MYYYNILIKLPYVKKINEKLIFITNNPFSWTTGKRVKNKPIMFAIIGFFRFLGFVNIVMKYVREKII